MGKIALKNLLCISSLCFVIFGCTDNNRLQTSRWSEGAGEPPVLPVAQSNLARGPEFQSETELVQISSEKISGFLVEDSYVKSVSQKNRGIVFQSYGVLGEISEQQIANAKKIDLEKANSWSLLLKRNPDLKGWSVLEAPSVIFAKRFFKFQPVLSATLISKVGEFYTVTFSDTGRLLKMEKVGSQLGHSEEAFALAFPKGPKKSELTQVVLTRKPEVKGLENDQVSLQSQSPVKILNDRDLEVHPPDDRFDQVQAYYFSNQLLQWLEKKGAMQGPINLSILTHVGYPDQTNTAFYYRGQVRLGSGDDVVFSRIPWDPSIVMHETSHAVIDLLSRLPYQGEGGAINEGFADTLTTLHLDSPLLGDVSYKKAPFKRSVEPLLKLSERTGGLYHDSLVVSGFFWSIRKSFGTDRALKLCLRVLNRLGPLSDFKDFNLTLNEQVEKSFEGSELKKVHEILKERDLL